jgi:uncharacterized protein (TIGR02246 family)
MSMTVVRTPGARRPFRIFPTLLLLAIAGCTTPAPEPTPEASSEVAPAAEEAALMKADRDFLRALQERGAEGWASTFAVDGIQIPGGSPVAWGRDEIRRLAEQLFTDASFSLTWEPVYARVAASGDLGYTLGNYVAEGTTPGGEPLRQEGNYVTLWRKQEDGTWKVALDIGNPGPHTDKPKGW